MLIVLGQSHDVSLRRDLQATATTHFHIRTLKLADEYRVALEHSNVEPVAVTVANQDVTSVTDVNSIWVVSQVLATDTTQKLPFFTEYHDAVTLQ